MGKNHYLVFVLFLVILYIFRLISLLECQLLPKTELKTKESTTKLNDMQHVTMRKSQQYNNYKPIHGNGLISLTISNHQCVLTTSLNHINSLENKENKQIGIQHEITAFSSLVMGLKMAIETTVQGIRNQLLAQLKTLFPHQSAALLAGIILGEQGLFSKDLLEMFRTSGLIHIVVASGGNIALLTSVVFATAQSYLSRRKTMLITFGCVLCYVLLAGLEPPLIRASIMVCLTMSALLFGRKTFSLYTLIITALVMIIVDPLLLFSLSFQLSFAATAGIVLFGGMLRQYLTVKLAHYSWAHFLVADISQTIAAQLCVTPLLLHTFGQTNIFSLIANSLVVPLVAPVMIGGVVVLGLSYLLFPLAVFFSWLLTILTEYIIWISFFFSHVISYAINLSLNWLIVFIIWVVSIWWWHRNYGASAA